MEFYDSSIKSKFYIVDYAELVILTIEIVHEHV